MKVLCLLGSPRKDGNSAKITKRLGERLEEQGAEVTSVFLNTLNYKGCQGCMACKTKLEKCVLKDDLTDILDEIHETDVLIISSSVYFGDVTAQMKTFIDRIYSFYVPDFVTNPIKSRLKPGKKVVFILSQGNPDETLFADIYPKYTRFFKNHNFDESYLVRACGVREKNDILSRDDIFNEVEAVVEKII